MTTSRRLHPLLIALAFMFTLPLSGCWDKSPESRIEDAKQAIQKSDYKAAVIELKSALQDVPSNAEARLLLGESLYLVGDYPSADKELKKAIELGAPADRAMPLLGRVLIDMEKPERVIDEVKFSPTLSPSSLAIIHAARVNAFIILGKTDGARYALAEGEKANPKHPEILISKARLALIDQKQSQALQLVEAALADDKKFSKALYLKAALLSLDKDEKGAINIYQQIIANDPKEFRAQIALAQKYMDAKDMVNATKSIEAAERVAPAAPMVKYGRALLELQRGKFKEANAAVLQVLRIAPDHLPSLIVDTATNFGLGNYEQSRKSAEKVLAQRPDELLASKYLAASLLQLNNPKEALTIVEARLKTHSQDAQLMSLAGDASQQLRDFDKATRYYERASGANPSDAIYLQRLAAGQLARGLTVQAEANLEKAVGLSAKPGQADISLIMLYLNRGKPDAALKAIAALEQKLPNSPVTNNMRGAAYLGKKNYPDARKSFEQALAIKPDYFPAAANLAQLDLRDKRPDAAKKRFESILAKDKNNIQAMLALADFAKAEKKEKEYFNWLQTAANANPKSLDAGIRLVRYHMDKREANKALARANELVNANPGNADALKLLGATHLALKDHVNAISSFSRLAQLTPQDPGAHYQLALAQVADKQYSKARATLEKTLQLQPAFAEARDTLLGIALSEGKTSLALQIAKEIQTRHPKSRLGFDREGDIQASEKNLPQAIKAYEQAMARGAGSAGMVKLHRTLFLSGDRKRAEQRMLGYINSHPNDVAARAYAALIYTRTGKHAEAAKQYEAMLALKPNNAAVLNDLAYAYQQVGDNRSLATAELAVKVKPDNVSAMDTLGWILVQQGQHQRALDVLKRALTQAPKQASIRYHYAVALARNGNKVEARQQLNSLLSSGQKFAESEQARSLLDGL